MHVLIIDDSSTMRALLQFSLMPVPGITVTTAKNGAEGLTLVEKLKPVLILVDVNMPVMTGHEFVDILRRQRGDTATPVVMITTLGEAEDIAKGLALGATAYVTKPINGAKLIQTITPLLPKA